LQDAAYGDVDLRILGEGPLPPLKLGLPFKPAPLHSAATEIDASLASHPPIDYKVKPIFVPPPNFTHIKISSADPVVSTYFLFFSEDLALLGVHRVCCALCTFWFPFIYLNPTNGSCPLV